jgi:uncharacterized protein YraI
MPDEYKPKNPPLSWMTILGTTGLITGALTLLGTVFTSSLENLATLRLERLKYEYDIVTSSLEDLSSAEKEDLPQKKKEIAERLEFIVDIGAIRILKAKGIRKYIEDPERIPSSIPLSGGRRFPDAGTAYICPPPGYNVSTRSGPGSDHPIVDTLAPGTAITITGYYDKGWAQLTDRSWVAGNLICSSLLPMNRGSAALAYIAPPTGHEVHVHSGPGEDYPVTSTLASGTAITITGVYNSGWAQLADGDWVASNLIRIGTPNDVSPTQTPSSNNESEN